MLKKFFFIFFVICISPLFAGQKIIEKGVMEVTNDSTGEVSYKILWRVPDSTDSFWLDAVLSDSSDAFSGEMNFNTLNNEPMPAISIGEFTVTEEGMKRAIRAIEDIALSANRMKGGNSSGGGGGGGC